MAVQHLLATRGPDLVLVNGPDSIAQCSDRRKGALAAYAEAGLGPKRRREIHVPNMDVEWGKKAAASLLQGDALPEGVFATNDLLALGVVTELMSAGLQVPRSVALMGYGDLPVAQSSPVPLSTVEQPKAELGRAAVEMILLEMTQDGPAHKHSARVFQPQLIVRDSAPARA